MLPVLAALLMITAACTKPAAVPAVTSLEDEERNSVYYWKTVFHLDSADHAFLRRHHINRMYLRMFDVTRDPYDESDNGRTVPNASVRVRNADYWEIRDSLGGMEFVPVVYITLDALKSMNRREGVLASNIVTRVRNMCEYNGLPNVGELQLDCDWTPKTENSFFILCDSVRRCIDRLGLPWSLSSTIRLHQLSRQAPPVDNGVLMVYNTGNFSDPDAANSIIDIKDVKPYLKHLPGYKLHLDVAYPTYSWQLLFHKRQFAGLMSGVNLADTSLFARRGDNVYAALRDVPYGDRIIRQGDMVREEISAFDDIIAVKSEIERKMRNRPHTNILYHLDNKNLSKYKPHEIDSIL